ncbi:hypothetical protein IWW48_000705 [Coemansia sp. RSA 1200]|nr:hypothetical protein IWW48_000705 [Coemansia sp. RSA 1200]
MLKCCAAQLPDGYYASNVILNHPVFNTHEFASFCDIMQTEASDEIRTLVYDLNFAFGSGEQYHTQTSGAFIAPRGDPYEKPEGLQPPISDVTISGRGIVLPPISSPKKDAIMGGESPNDETFSPTISSSPPVSMGEIQSAAPDAMTADSPHSTENRIKNLSIPEGSQPMSHSLPSRPLDHWGDENSRSAATTTANTPSSVGILYAPKRRRPEYGGGPFLPALSGMPMSTSGSHLPVRSPRTTANRIHGPPYSQYQRIARSPPRMSYSPNIPVSNIESSHSVNRSPRASLPSIAQFSRSPTMPSSLMHVGSPNIGRGSGQQHYLHPHQQQQYPYSNLHPYIGNAQRRDPDTSILSDNSMRRPSDSATGENSSNSGRVDMVAGRDEYGLSEIEQIKMLREENAYLRQRLQRLEASVTQKHSEVLGWMNHIEKQFARKDSN